MVFGVFEGFGDFILAFSRHSISVVFLLRDIHSSSAMAPSYLTEAQMLQFGLKFARFKSPSYLNAIVQAELGEEREGESEPDEEIEDDDDAEEEEESDDDVTPDEVFDEFLKDDKRFRLHLRRFKACYGSAPQVICAIWWDLQTADISEARISNVTVRSLERLLMTMYFLKTNLSEHCMAGIFQLSEPTVRKWCWAYAAKIQALKAIKIVWEDLEALGGDEDEEEDGEHEEEDGEEELRAIRAKLPLTVDGVHCRVLEQGHPTNAYDTAYFSHKSKSAGLAYEIALLVHHSRCVWMNGPFPAGKNDLSMFRAGLAAKIPEGMKVIADKGYNARDVVDIISTPNSHDSKKVSEYKSRARARQETFNARLKNFGVLEQRFRHDLEKHKIAFEAVAVICQYQLENCSPLFDV